MRLLHLYLVVYLFKDDRLGSVGMIGSYKIVLSSMKKIYFFSNYQIYVLWMDITGFESLIIPNFFKSPNIDFLVHP